MTEKAPPTASPKAAEEPLAPGKRKWTMEEFQAARRLATVFADVTDFGKTDNTITYMALLLMQWKIYQDQRHDMSFEAFQAHVFEDLGNMHKNLKQPDEWNYAQKERPLS